MKEKKVRNKGEYTLGVVVASWVHFFVVVLIGLVARFSDSMDWAHFFIFYGMILFIIFGVAMFFTIDLIYIYKYKKEQKNEL